MIDRAVPRVVPNFPITLAMEEPGQATTFGLIADISGKGACALTFSDLDVGAIVHCSLRFPKEAESLEVSGRVVWLTRSARRPFRFGRDGS